jgi:hypothetical protein
VGPKTAAAILQAREHCWLLRKVKFNDAVQERKREARAAAASAMAPAAANGGAAAAAAGAAPPSAGGAAAAAGSLEECECASMDDCRHVKAFKSTKKLFKIEGLSRKLAERLQDQVTV